MLHYTDSDQLQRPWLVRLLSGGMRGGRHADRRFRWTFFKIKRSETAWQLLFCRIFIYRCIYIRFKLNWKHKMNTSNQVIQVIMSQVKSSLKSCTSKSKSSLKFYIFFRVKSQVIKNSDSSPSHNDSSPHVCYVWDNLSFFFFLKLPQPARPRLTAAQQL